MMLEVADLQAAYGRIPILQGISFEVGAGELVGILGHNGMGKTTLLRTLIGQLPATGGSIRFGGFDVTRDPAHRRARQGIGYVPQGRAIFPALSVRDNLRMGYAGRGAPRAEGRKIDEIVAEFPRLASMLERVGGTLSGGEQQILALARALCGSPHLLLLDEPTEGIQPSIIGEIIENLKALHARRGLAVVVVEQNLEFIASLSQRVLMIEKGRITRSLQPEEMSGARLAEALAGS